MHFMPKLKKVRVVSGQVRITVSTGMQATLALSKALGFFLLKDMPLSSPLKTS